MNVSFFLLYFGITASLRKVAADQIILNVSTNACARLIRLGNIRDGGWNACDTFRQVAKSGCLVYSYGIKDDFSFDQACEKLGCQVFGFDPSVRLENDYNSKNRKFSSIGLGKTGVYRPGRVAFRWPGIDKDMTASNTVTWRLSSISDMKSSLGHVKTDIKILKIDVEGSEWFGLQDLLASGLLTSGNVEQLLIELHFDPEKYTVSASSTAIEITRKVPDDLDYFSLLHQLHNTGMRLWNWRWNDDNKCCIEVAYIFSGSKGSFRNKRQRDDSTGDSSGASSQHRPRRGEYSTKKSGDPITTATAGGP